MGIEAILERLKYENFEAYLVISDKLAEDAKYIRELEMEVDAARMPSRGKRRRFDDED